MFEAAGTKGFSSHVGSAVVAVAVGDRLEAAELREESLTS
jgi:hypothetical protein